MGSMTIEAGKELINIRHRVQQKIAQVQKWIKSLGSHHLKIWIHKVCLQEEAADQDKDHEVIKIKPNMEAVDNWKESFLALVLK